jgi:hypothetical protein
MATVGARNSSHVKRFYRSGAADVGPETRKTTQKDAIVFLRQARDSVMSRIRNGSLKNPDSAHLLAMQALNILQGE